MGFLAVRFREFILFYLFFCHFSQQAWARMFERKIHTIEEIGRIDTKKAWVKLATSKKRAVEKIFHFLERSPTGKKILLEAKKKAKDQGVKLADLVEAGEHSLLDTTLVRKFLSDQPDQIFYRSRSKILINRRLSLVHALLDMVHELTHFARRGPFNPYQEGFNLKNFIVSTIEGKGGEVDAYRMECQVFFELFPQFRSHGQGGAGRSSCHRIFDLKRGKLFHKKGVEEFYKVGQHYHKILRKLEQYKVSATQIQGLSQQEAQFISSTYEVPYPLAAILEYESIIKRVCHNDRKRLKYLDSKRHLASEQSLSKRCFD